MPSALSSRYAVLRAPARRSDTPPPGFSCRVGDLHVFAGGARLVARHGRRSATYLLPVYERRTADGYTGLAVCAMTLTRRARYVESTGGCFSNSRDSSMWFGTPGRTVAAVPDGVARVRLQLTGEPAEREVAVRRNAVVLGGAAPVSWTWLGGDGAVVTRESAPFVCED